MELNNIQQKTTWNDAAESINSNNLKIVSEVTKLQNATYKNKGYFKTVSDLTSTCPTASLGSKAYVGNSYPYAIYLWEGGEWVNSGSTGGEESVELGNYYTKAETDVKLTELESELGKTEIVPYITGNGIYTRVGIGNVVDFNNRVGGISYKAYVVEVSEGDEVIVNAQGGGTPATYAICDSNKALKEIAPENAIRENYSIIAKEGDAYIIINDKTGGTQYLIKKNSVEKELSKIDTTIAHLDSKIEDNKKETDSAISTLREETLFSISQKADKSEIGKVEIEPYITGDGIYTNVTEGEVVDLENKVGGTSYKAYVIEVSEGDEIIVNATGGGTPLTYVTTDADFRLIRKTGQNAVRENFSLIIESGESYVIINDKTGGIQYLIKKNSVEKELSKKVNNADFSEYKEQKDDEQMMEVANGRLKAYGTFLSEKDATCLVNDPLTQNVGFHKIKRPCARPINYNIVAINHDDLPQSDYEGTRRIYNKYGFNATFSYILHPFASLEQKEREVTNIKKLLADGHELGLHAIFGQSYWRFNSLFDVTPNGESNFAPLVSELKGSNSDGTGINVFGKNVTSSTLLSAIGYWSLPSEYTATKVVSLTKSMLDAINQSYNIYSDNRKIEGLDFFDEDKSKTCLEWLEHFYYRLVDSSLGYSSSAATLAERFAEDYDTGGGVGQYPDAEHILNGKMIYYADTGNPNYNNSDYQIVGKFTKGLFKGCYSTCNYEVMDRVIAVATAFCQHYFGMTTFADAHRHGLYYVDCQWKDDDGIAYRNREKSVVDGAFGRYYRTRIAAISALKDIFDEQGVKSIIQDGNRPNMSLYGQVGLYYGQDGIRTPGQNMTIGGQYGYVGYPQLFGISPNEGIESGTYSDFMKFMDGVENWSRFIFENAGKTITRNGLTRTIYPSLKATLNAIVGSIQTGAVPKISFDSLSNNPAVMAGVELVLRCIRDLGFDAVPFGKAHDLILSRNRRMEGNIFPNPSFNQSMVLKLFERASSSDMSLPDGWSYSNGALTTDIIVSKMPVDGKDRFTMQVSPQSGVALLHTRMYGLPSGKYKLSFYLRCMEGSPDTRVMVYNLKNKDKIDISENAVIKTFKATSDWVLCEHIIEIDAPHQNKVDITNGISMVCDGREDNTVCIQVRMRVDSGYALYIAEPSMIRL